MRLHLLLCAAIVAAISTSAWGVPQATTPIPAVVTAAAPVAPAPQPTATSAPAAAPAPAACVPTPREIRGDNVDNDCDGTIDEALTKGQLLALVDDEVAGCSCKDASTKQGKEARDLALKAMTAANKLGQSVDPASVELIASDCTQVQLEGYEWDGAGWATAGSASRLGRAAYGVAVQADKKADKALVGVEANSAADKEAWESHDQDENDYRQRKADQWTLYTTGQSERWNELAGIESRQDAGIDMAQFTANDAKVMATAESEARQAADDELATTGATFGVEALFTTVVAGEIIDRGTGTMLRQGTAVGGGLGLAWGYWFNQTLGVTARISGSVLSEGTRGGLADFRVGPLFKVKSDLALSPELVGAIHGSGWGLANTDVTSKVLGGGIGFHQRLSDKVGIVGGFTAGYDVPSTAGNGREHVGQSRVTYLLHLGVQGGGWR